MSTSSFSIFSFSEALDNLKVGHDIERRNLRLRLVGKTIMMIMDDDEMCPWLPTHKDILATDWKVIKFG